MKPVMIYRRATVKGLPLYKCIGCGVQAIGDTVTIELSSAGMSAKELSEELEARNFSNHHIPVGWAGYTEGVRCGRCKK